jgi:hypothetical protein
MDDRMYSRRGTAEEWALINPILSAGEMGFETDTGIIKFGDGTTAWVDIRVAYVLRNEAGDIYLGKADAVETYITQTEASDTLQPLLDRTGVSFHTPVALQDDGSLQFESYPTADKFDAITFALSSWTLHDTYAKNRWNAITWSPELHLFCAVANGLDDAFSVLTSPDGVVWTPRSGLATGYSWHSVVWSPALHLFCAVGEANNQVMTSPDGVTWTVRNNASLNAYWLDVCWSPELGIFCAVGYSFSSSLHVMTSPDGITWTASNTVPNDVLWYYVTWSPELHLFCALSNDGYIMTSPDGRTWTARVAPPTKTTWMSIAWSPTLHLFCAVGMNAYMCATSSDGITWVDRTNSSFPKTGLPYDVIWCPELELFCLIRTATSGADKARFLTSPDGFNWTAHIGTPLLSWNDICWSPELDSLCAIASSSGGQNASMISMHIPKELL